MNTITADDWRRMFAAYRARGHYEGRAMLSQIRAAMSARKQLSRSPAHMGMCSQSDSNGVSHKGNAGDRDSLPTGSEPKNNNHVAGEVEPLPAGSLSSGLPTGDASQTAQAAAVLRRALGYSAAKCESQSSHDASGHLPGPPLEKLSAVGRGVCSSASDAKDPREGRVIGLRPQQLNFAA